MMLNSNTDIVTSGPSTSLLSIQLANCLCMFVFVVSCFSFQTFCCRCIGAIDCFPVNLKTQFSAMANQ